MGGMFLHYKYYFLSTWRNVIVFLIIILVGALVTGEKYITLFQSHLSVSSRMECTDLFLW